MKEEIIKVIPKFITENAYEVIEAHARNCYQSQHKIEEGSAEKLIKLLISKNHGAMFEFAHASFEFIVNRGVSHEMVRHRLASFAQESTRYCNYSSSKFNKEITLIKQEDYDLTTEQLERRKKLFTMIEETYNAETAEGVPAQIARDVLPLCLKTNVMMSTNIREWRHILTLRTSIAAHPQIARAMNIVYDILVSKYPLLFNDIGPNAAKCSACNTILSGEYCYKCGSSICMSIDK